MFRMDNQELAEQLHSIASQLSKLAAQIAEKNEPEAISPQSALEKVADGICLICDNPITPTEKHNRGAHHKCYAAMLDEIKRGSITEAQAIASGKLLAPRKGGRKPSESRIKLAEFVMEVTGQYEGTAKAAKKPPTKPKPGKP